MMFHIPPPQEPKQEDEQQDDPNRELSEDEKVAAWKMLKLLDAGCPYELAVEILT